MMIAWDGRYEKKPNMYPLQSPTLFFSCDSNNANVKAIVQCSVLSSKVFWYEAPFEWKLLDDCRLQVAQMVACSRHARLSTAAFFPDLAKLASNKEK
jgi:hypothetical protein